MASKVSARQAKGSTEDRRKSRRKDRVENDAVGWMMGVIPEERPMSFQIVPLSRGVFAPLFELSDAALGARRAMRVRADAKPGFPCRISLEDAEPGEELLLVNFEHQSAESPFRSSHAVYVRPDALEAELPPNALPGYFVGRTISLRAFDRRGMIIGAELVEGEHTAPAIEALFAASPAAAYLHAHFAKYGCYACRIDRAGP
jgi:hypothetical protein